MTEYTIKDVGPLLYQLWRSKWILMFVTLSGLLAGLAVTADKETEVRYSAMSSVCVTYTTYQEQMRGSSVITSYADMVTSRLVCERAAEFIADTELTAENIQRMTENWVGGNSYVMYINATSANPQHAVLVANAVAQAFTEKVLSVSGNNSLQLLDAARTATALRSDADTMILISAACPLVFACAFILLREVHSGKIRFLSQCVEDEGELLGIIPDVK